MSNKSLIALVGGVILAVLAWNSFYIVAQTEKAVLLQFGRIEGGAYTLDFRLPFTATQAFAVALASITQRLK